MPAPGAAPPVGWRCSDSLIARSIAALFLAVTFVGATPWEVELCVRPMMPALAAGCLGVVVVLLLPVPLLLLVLVVVGVAFGVAAVVVFALVCVVPGVDVAGGEVAVTLTSVALALELFPESPASATSAAASTPSDSSATAATAATGPFQRGAAASRVRAAAPQRRHQSCSGYSGPAHSGQASPAGAEAPEAALKDGGEVATLTILGPVGE